MPCDTIRSTTVDIGKMNLDILEKGLRAAGYQITLKDSETKVLQFKDSNRTLHRYENGTLSASGTIDTNAIKRAYSQQVVRQISNQFGWKLSAFGKDNTATATKRRF